MVKLRTNLVKIHNDSEKFTRHKKQQKVSHVSSNKPFRTKPISHNYAINTLH